MFASETFKDIKGPGFGLMFPVCRSEIRSPKGSNAGGINIVDLIVAFFLMTLPLQV